MGKITKTLRDIFRRGRPVVKPRHEIPPLEGASINLCLTTLLNDRKRPVWTHGHLKTAPWSRVLESRHLAPVRDQAETVYNAMDAAGACVPTVTWRLGSVRIEYASDGEGPPRVVVFLLDPGRTRFGMGVRGEPYNLHDATVDAKIGGILGRWLVEGVAG